jgi:hypothetical protein
LTLGADRLHVLHESPISGPPGAAARNPRPTMAMSGWAAGRSLPLEAARALVVAGRPTVPRSASTWMLSSRGTSHLTGEMPVMSETQQAFASPHAAGLFFIAAKQAAKRAREMRGRLGEEYEAMAAVVLCVIVAESGINEISEWFEFHHWRPPFSIPHGLPYGFDAMELRLKWSLLPMIMRQRTFDRSAEPWQSFHALVELRNAIVHLRRRPLPKAAAGLLEAKNLVNDSDLLGFKVARWACDTMASMFAKLTELVDPPKDWIDQLWCWTPTHSFPYGLTTPGDPSPD